MTIGRLTTDLGADDFTHPVFRAVWELVAAAGGVGAGVGDPAWAGEAAGRDRATRRSRPRSARWRSSR